MIWRRELPLEGPEGGNNVETQALGRSEMRVPMAATPMVVLPDQEADLMNEGEESN
jgi:hypothetical protein